MKEKLKSELHKRSQNTKRIDVDKTLKQEHKVKEKIKNVPAKFKKLIKQIKLFYELLKDYAKGNYTEIPWGTISVIVAALAYFLAPLDAIPDILPIVGFMDDAFLFMTAINFIQEDLKHYCIWKGWDPEEYF